MIPRWASAVALFAVSLVGCTRSVPSGGLLVQLWDDGTLNPVPDHLHVKVGAPDGGRTYGSDDYPLGKPDGSAEGSRRLLASFVIESNGNAKASVAIHVSVWSGGRPLDVRDYQASDIPTDHYEQRDIVFSGSCSRWAELQGGADVSTCTQPATTCDPNTGDCASNVLSAGPGSSPSQGVDATIADGEAGAPQAALAGEGGEDGGLEAEASPDDGNGVCIPDADTPRCDGDTPQQCAVDGLWQDQTGCSLQGAQHCEEGRCVPNPVPCTGQTRFPSCVTYEVSGGLFYRSNDSLHVDMSAAATVSQFRLDEFEIPVWRFAQFVSAVEGGWVPPQGAGKHTHLHGGQGLMSGGTGASIAETGWDSSWNSQLPTTSAQWNTNLTTCLASTWTSQSFVNTSSNQPINCVTWYDAYAYCIWDGAFLPSEAEWNFAAAGGSEQRLYPWGDTAPGPSGAYAIYGCIPSPLGPGAGAGETSSNCQGSSAIATEAPFTGRGRYGQLDMAGNLAEWTLDVYVDYVTPCDDCAALTGGTQRVFRGGAFDKDFTYLYTSKRAYGPPDARQSDVGFRCARVP